LKTAAAGVRRVERLEKECVQEVLKECVRSACKKFSGGLEKSRKSSGGIGLRIY
jgi:hypothetical protein